MSRKPAIAVAVVAIAAAAAALTWWLWPRDREDDDLLAASGTVEATESILGFQMPGTVVWIGPREGDEVTAGQPLARLATAELEAQLRQGRARAEAAAARLRELERGSRAEELAQARAATAAARRKLADAERDLDRTRALFEGGAEPRQALDKAELARDLAAAGAEQTDEQLRLVQAGPRRERVEAAAAEQAAAEAAVEAVEAKLADAALAAPGAGVVAVRHREPGEVVGAGTPVVTLQDLGSRWVRIYVREDRIGAVALGAAARIRSDTYPDRTVPGEVFFIASEAEFTPENVQTPEERVRLVYAVKVRVTGDPEHRLKPGMPVDVEIDRAERPAGEATG